jgi:O-antigen/teichoic acid export membrane protein
MPVVGGLGLSFILSIALARWLGAAEFGTYTYVLSWVAILATATLFGLDTTIVRDVPAYASIAAWGLLRGLLRWAVGVTLLVSLSLAVFAVLARSQLVRDGQLLPSSVWLIAGLLVPLMALSRVQQSGLRGLNRVAVSQLPESVLVPAVMLGFIAVAVQTGAISPTAEHALVAQVIAVGMALVAAVGLVYRALPDAARAARPRHLHRAWLMTSGRMFLLTGLSALNGRIGIIMLGSIATPQVVGPYAVALRGSGFISLALNVAVLAMAPTIAGAYAKGQLARLQLVARQMSRIALIGGLPLAAALLLWGRSFLFLFGPGFEIATTALTILILGEVVNIAAGPVATLLVMTGHERDAVLGLAVGTAMNAALCLILIPQWGINGAAIAAAAGVVLWNVVMWQFVRRRLAFTITILAGGVPRPPSPPET